MANEQQYFFVLGSHPALSIAEITILLERAISGECRLSDDSLVLAAHIKGEIDADNLMRRLGGAVKIGTTINNFKFPVSNKIFNTEIISRVRCLHDSGKFYYGFSLHGDCAIDIKPAAMQIKEALKAEGTSSRWVTSKASQLSSVVVEMNRLVSRGAEFVIARFGGSLMLGRTLSVQPFRELSALDYGRPARDDRSGMLPPKLARIMINLAGAPQSGTILDPFCGSGTILTEATLMGFDNLIGSDISGKAVEDAKRNMEWTTEKTKSKKSRARIILADARTISKQAEPGSIDAVVTEPYLGPQRGRYEARSVARELEGLYTEAIKESFKVLKAGGRAVMAWPLFRDARNSGLTELRPEIGGFRIIDPLPPAMANRGLPGVTKRNTLLYGRPDQKIWREIVVLQK